jgi:hypothetical protein
LCCLFAILAAPTTRCALTQADQKFRDARANKEPASRKE